MKAILPPTLESIMTQPWRRSCNSSNVQSLSGHEREHQDNAKAAEQITGWHGNTQLHRYLGDVWRVTEFSANEVPAEAGLNKSGKTLKSLLDY